MVQKQQDLESGSAVVFPGQGCQKIGMAHDFYSSYAQSRSVFARASAALGLDIAEICFTPNALLDLTEYTQPAILTSEIAILNVLVNEFGFKPRFFAGHSLGEYSALVAAGVISLEDALQIVRTRGARMQSALPEGTGAMAALILDQIDHQQVRLICDHAGCDVANYNSNAQLVISGKTESVQRARAELAAKFATMQIVALNVSTAFHSKLMQPIEAGFARVLDGFAGRFNLENVGRVLSNYTGTFHAADSLLASLVHQISMPVRWIDNMQALASVSKQIYEVGPQRVLGKFFSALGLSAVSITDLRSLNKNFQIEHACEV